MSKPSFETLIADLRTWYEKGEDVVFLGTVADHAVQTSFTMSYGNATAIGILMMQQARTLVPEMEKMVRSCPCAQCGRWLDNVRTALAALERGDQAVN